MARKKTLGLSSLNKFKIKKTGPKYLPRTRESTDEKIFSQLVHSAISQIGRASESKSADNFSGNSGGAPETTGFQTAFTSLLKNYISSSATAGRTTALFRPSQSQAGAEALKNASLGKRNL